MPVRNDVAEPDVEGNARRREGGSTGEVVRLSAGNHSGY
jgi:hypothetical protein